MGVAVLGGVPFRIDPDTVSWQFQINASVTQTIGGKVVQVYGASVSHMTISGSYGQDFAGKQDSWQMAEKFVSQVQAWGISQSANIDPPPLRFTYPPRSWDFNVYVAGLADPDGGSVTHSAGKFSYKYTLDLFVANDNSGVTTAPISAFISRLSEGIGWTQTTFNGPLTNADVSAALNGQSVQDYLEQQFAAAIGASAAGNGG